MEANQGLSYTIALPTIYGDVLVNRFDKNQTNMLLKTGAAHDREKIMVAGHVCRQAQRGALMLDVGANFGLYALACARTLQPLGGAVHAWEGQRMLSYMIAGSAALNSLENLFVHHACVGNSTEPVPIPRFDYFQPMNFGSVEFGATQHEPLDQKRQTSTESVRQVRLDDLELENVCMIKIDVEGMEEAVLDGCAKTIKRNRPIVLIEYLKSDAARLAEFFRERNYTVHVYNGDFLCIPQGQTIKGLNNTLPEYVPGTKMERI